jgi:phosphoadenosine phosphosulfate reductase
MSFDRLQRETIWTIDTALERAERPCITCSFQASGMVLLHMLRTRRPDIPVLFIDTLHHFAETLAYRDRMTKEWQLNLIALRAAAPSVGLWRESTDACCRRHKIDPLFSALASYTVWFSGLRRDQSASRAQLEEIDSVRLPSGTTLTKISPLAQWTTKDVWLYAKAHGIPLLPLYEAGYTSVGCEPCTSLPLDGSNVRSGRWQGEKLECGIHIELVPTA